MTVLSKLKSNLRFLFIYFQFIPHMAKVLVLELFSDSFSGVLIHFYILLASIYYSLACRILGYSHFTLDIFYEISFIAFTSPSTHFSIISRFFDIFLLSKILHTELLCKFLYLTLIVHLLGYFNSTFINHFFQLSEENCMLYYNLAMEFLAESAFLAISYNHILSFDSIIPFTFLYVCKSNAWVFGILAEQYMHQDLLYYAVFITITILSILYFSTTEFDLSYFSIFGLLAFEYLLSLFYVVKAFFLLLMDIYDVNSAFLTFLINISYLTLRIILTLFYAKNMLRFRLPITYIKMVITDSLKLLDKTKSFLVYLSISRYLWNLPDVAFDPVSSCAICADDMNKGKVLECDHAFHVDCLSNWVSRESTCPICRMKLPA